MRPLFTTDQLLSAKYTDSLSLLCTQCGRTFDLTKKRILDITKYNKGSGEFCSQSCKGLHKTSVQTFIANCAFCNTQTQKPNKEANKSKLHFCSHACRAKHYNSNKIVGIRVSKLETWLQTQLTKLYPRLEFHFNRKDAINSELDIYLPSLRLAFELNGIFHYEPIYGDEKLQQTQNNDQRKFQACLERNIELCIIDSSSQKRFTETSSQKYLDIINIIITKRLARESNSNRV